MKREQGEHVMGGLKCGKKRGKWCHILIYKLKNNDLTALQTHSVVCTNTYKYILRV